MIIFNTKSIIYLILVQKSSGNGCSNFHSHLITLVCMIYWTVGPRTIMGFHDCFKTIKWGKIRVEKTKSRELRCFCGILFLNAFLQSSWKESALMGNWRPHDGGQVIQCKIKHEMVVPSARLMELEHECRF